MPKADRTSPWVGQAGGGDRSRPGVGVGGADLETGLAELDSAGLEVQLGAASDQLGVQVAVHAVRDAWHLGACWVKVSDV